MTLVEKINESEDALHQLNIGKRVAKITRDGKSVEFTPANRSELERYINILKSQLLGIRRKPLGVRL